MSATWDTRLEPGASVAAGMPRIAFLARSLRRGGAERQLVALACGLHRRGWPVLVVCCYGGGAFEGELRDAGVPLVDLHKRGRWDIAGFGWRLLRTLRQSHAAIVHGYMPLANLLALLARVARPGTRVVWGVRSSVIRRDQRDWLARTTFWLSCHTARLADRIIANSEAGATYHVARGYPHGRLCVIPNGIDVRRFHFDPTGRERLRREWHVPDDGILVGLVGRVDPMKDHATFLRAAARLAAHDARWRFVCVGGGQTQYVAAARALGTQLGLDPRLLWAGPTSNVAVAYSAVDVVVSSSCGEGFSNVIAEAMACERACVVTDVGDSARIVGDCGLVVPPGQPEALAAAVERTGTVLADPAARARLGARARARVVEHYSLDALLRRSGETLRALCPGAGKG